MVHRITVIVLQSSLDMGEIRRTYEGKNVSTIAHHGKQPNRTENYYGLKTHGHTMDTYLGCCCFLQLPQQLVIYFSSHACTN